MNKTTFYKLWRLLNAEQHLAAILLLGLMLVGMVLETLGIGLIVPALAIMVQGDLGSKYHVLKPWLDSHGSISHGQLVATGMEILVAVYIVKTVFLGFLAWRQMKFVYDVQTELSQRLFVGYLRQPYSFHLQRNSAQLIRNVVNEINLFTQNGLISALLLLTEVLVIFAISILLISVEPGALLVVAVFGFAGWGFYRITRKKVLNWGEARLYHDELRVQYLQQGLGGAKDVKLLGRESDFLAQYHYHSDANARAAQFQATIQALPRLWLELLAVAGVAALVLVKIAQGRPMDTILPSLGLFVAVAFRLMPSVNRILGAMQGIRYSLPVIDILHSEVCLLGEPEFQQSQSLYFEKHLQLDRVSFHYPGVSSKALRDVSLSITRGSSVGFIGGSGAGKSTLVDIILGLFTPTSGVIKVDGVDIQSNLRGWQNLIGYVPQTIFLTDDTLRRNVAFGLSSNQIDEAAVWRAIRAAQLEQFVNDLPLGLDTVVGERGIRLSGGQRQRIGIARALYHDPSVLVLDEATSSLDMDTEKDVMDAVRCLKGDKTILIVAHRMSTVADCDRIFRLQQGILVEEGDAFTMLGI